MIFFYPLSHNSQLSRSEVEKQKEPNIADHLEISLNSIIVFELWRYFLVFSVTGVGGWGHSAEVRILITVMASTLLRPARPAQRWTIESEDPPKWFWNWDVQWDQAALLNYWEDFPTVKLQPTCSSQSDLRQSNNSAGGSDHINLPLHTRHSNFNIFCIET